ncbi:MAG: YraN family protein [Spirochaetia bacterium]|nr:YraN family protein [Spirochaetia bacterium]MBQ3647858.1 YraN family protein [Spirochaetia bacterium]MBQ3713634.1 YraN family protein [Spirochaetia bacterium]MBQ6673476.1 YraN family protein [Spirochaetia bacterium]MBQ6905288.1 YraN family protein [Spirochaetia bacterium]
MNTFKKGKIGEESAEKYLIERGYTLVARNFKAHPGEIDLVMTSGCDLVFVEVKAWKNLPFADLEKSIDARKQHRIKAVSQVFMLQNPALSRSKTIRYDVLFVDGEGKITHIKDAFGDY